MSEQYFYRPLAFDNGSTLKCAGIVTPQNVDWVCEKFWKEHEEPYLLGVVIVDGYQGDKIPAQV